MNTKQKNSGRTSLFFIFALLLVLSACEKAPTEKQVTYSGPIMGTDYRISVVVDLATDLDSLEQDLIDAMQRVNQSMSTYIEDSEINQFNRANAGEKITLSPEFAEVLSASLEISRLSEGAFDVTLARAVNLWGFGPDGQIKKRPTEEKLDQLRDSVGYQKVELNDLTAVKANTDLSIDFSAIAKGYAVDKTATALRSRGINDFLINIGGELLGSGRKVGGAVWQVGIEKPHALGGIQEIARLDNQAIATSGDYRNFYTIDGQRFSHMIDATTLAPVFHRLALVSVISDSAMRADGLATAMMSMGELRAQEFAQKHDLAAYMIIREPLSDEYRTVITNKFKPLLQ